MATTQSLTPPTAVRNKGGWYILANPPNDQIYDFKGFFSTSMDEDNDEAKESLSLENTLW